MSNIIAYSRNSRPHVRRQYVGEEHPYSIELSKVETELGDTVASVTWSVVSGKATISDEALSASKATANILTSQTGRQLIKVTCTGSSTSHIEYIEIKVNDPRGMTGDY